jgi:hypothetical protein
MLENAESFPMRGNSSGTSVSQKADLFPYRAGRDVAEQHQTSWRAGRLV